MPYLPAKNYTLNNFSLTVHPFVNPPENRFDPNAAIQWGADFKSTFKRSGTQSSQLGIIQLIFPQVAVARNVPGRWNVDKQQAAAGGVTVSRALYGDDQTLIGNQSAFYAGQHLRSLGVNECSIIDTPREAKRAFDRRGVLSGIDNTKFANYVAELKGKDGVIFNAGMLWGYTVVQDAKDGNKFDLRILEPKKVLLKETNEHLEVIAAFLGLDKAALKALIS